MTSLHPVVDPRHFQDIVDEAKRRIPQYCPEWTDHNVSDPGITLIELFAWMTDLIRYRLNAMPERQYRHFLQLIGVQPRLPYPAQTELTFWLSTPPRETKLVPQGTEVATRQTGSDPAITFATDTDLQIRVPDLQHLVLGWYDPAAPATPVHRSATHLLREDRARIAVFQEQPQPNDAFYLGFRESLRNHVLRLQLQCETARGVNIMQDDPPLQWEYWDGDSWQSLAVSAADLALLPLTDAERRQYGRRLDATSGLNATGSVLLVVPRNATSTTLHVEGEALEAFWVRCRADRRDRGQPFYDATPVINGILAESIGGQVSASHQATHQNVELGRSDGSPGQIFPLPHAPILPRHAGETLEVERHDGGFELWQEVSSFAESRPADAHFVLDSASGSLQFGPVVPDAAGQEKHHGRVPPQGRLLRFTRYRTGGGQAGNVGSGSLVVPKSYTNLDYVQAITNLEPATGGRDGETLEELMLRGPSLVRTRDVAITQRDFEDLVTDVFPQVVRARCRANGQGVEGGSVEVTLVPALAPANRPLAPADLLPGYRQRRLQQEVAAYLRERAPVTVGVQVSLAQYQWVSVAARLVIRIAPGLAAYETEVERDMVRQQALRRLYGYLHPATGGPDGTGWPFELPLTAAAIRDLLEAVPGVRFAGDVRLRTVAWDGVDRRLGPDEHVLTPPPGAVFCSDSHVLEVAAE